ncbi:hypothetical protein LTR84_002333 [Exophiala bonariae]|uniref:Uncharacterized protein n=1 Tax=Exophiala bonariae TaxID=1690606 RepID=A0AAV9NDL6_9EURO|nr:hypothetical protein LTR84_002333 [Exophiala bonariae]
MWIYTTSEIAPSQAPGAVESRVEVKSVAAIVDALPYSETSTGRQRDVEGLSILFSSSLTYTEPAPPELTGDDSANYTLTFVSRSNAHDLSYQLGIGRRQLAVGYLTLPVANTFFVNGSRATLVEDTWRVTLQHSSTESEGKHDTLATNISHEQRKDLQSATIDAAFQYDAIGQSILPLTPLTKRRAITKAMGNVVTEIKTGATVVPASSELEKSVSDYIGKNSEATSAGPLLIYASVIPQFGAQFADPDSNLLLTLPPQSLQLQSWSMINNRNRCTRLFRVTGGGGGWGKKQGLLSLDPAVDFDGQSTVSSFPDIDDSGDIGQISEPKGMMPSLSTIQFWVFNNDSTPLAEDQRLDLDRIFGRSGVEQEKKNDMDKMYFVLGTGPRAEEREGIEGHERQALNRSEMQQQFVRGYFGMLAYGGAAVGSLQAQGENAAGPLYTGARSRVDVPNTTFVLEFEPATEAGAVRAARPKEKTS